MWTEMTAGSIKNEDLNKKLHIDDPHVPATFEYLKYTFDLLAIANAKDLTAVYDGHGNQKGYALWNGELLPYKTLNDLYEKFPPGTHIKSVFLSCYAGAVVVPAWRQVPHTLDSIQGFLKLYYPENRCALGTSSDNETGQFYGHWSEIFKKNPDLSIEKFQETLLAEPNIRSTPRSTMDYFLDDLSFALCAEAQSLSEKKAQYGAEPKKWPAEVREDLAQSLLLQHDFDKLPEIQKACADLESNPVHQARKDREQWVREYTQASSLMQKWTLDIVHSEFPELDTKDGTVEPNVEEIYAQYKKNGKDMGFPDLLEVMKMLATPKLDSTSVIPVLAHSKKLVALFNQKFREFMSVPKNSEKYKSFINPNYQKEDYPGIAIDELVLAVTSRADQSAVAQKQKESPFHVKQHVIMDSLFRGLSSLNSLKPRYESIKACENSPLRNAPFAKSPY